jgi:4-hydroxybenzoate polyprenyltransferase
MCCLSPGCFNFCDHIATLAAKFTCVDYIRLLRPKDWAKNLFLFVPLFFAGEIFNPEKITAVLPGFIAFCCMASAIYILNDYRDIEDDKKHPEKSKRPLASGSVNKTYALVICVLLVAAGITIGLLTKTKFLFVLGIYFLMNLAYSFGLKSMPILDVMLVAVGFVLRIKGGAILGVIGLTEWLTIMVFLLALFMAVGKRRDDVLLKLSSGSEMRKSIKGYNLEFLNVSLSLICSVIIVAYFMYTMSAEVTERYGSYRFYYTCIFILAGVLRYLQIIFVKSDSGSPTKILYKDRFIQACILLWVASFYIIIYLKDITIFK